MPQAWDESFDAVVVGAGAAGLTAALTAAAQGLKTLVVEKGEYWGGSTALSGGGIWIPLNPLMQRPGEMDTPEAAATYLDAVVADAGPATSPARKRAYLEAGPQMIGFLLERGVEIEQEPGQPDYHAERPGGRKGRLLEPAFTNGKKLGPWLDTLRPAPRPYAVKTGEGTWVAKGLSNLRSATTVLKVIVRDRWCRLWGGAPITSGAALAAQLMMGAQRAGVTVRLKSPLKRVIFEDGRAVGIEIEQDGIRRAIEARSGVFLCAGGFARDPQFRGAVQAVEGLYSSASPDDTGDVVKLAPEMGAAVSLMDEAWWGPSVLYPGNIPGFFLWERCLPGSLMVDKDAQRFTDEAQSYDTIGRDMLNKKVEGAWLILDTRHRQRYLFGGMPPGQTPRAMYDSGFFERADTIEGLAARCGLDPAALKATVDRFNGYARDGVDPEFRRGSMPYDNFWGDPFHKPNPNLGVVDKPPFLATRVYLGDLGTKGGLVTDEHGRVMREGGGAIEGLYAAGNATASVMGRGYPGPGATLGPAMTFAWLAARHAAARGSNSAA
jgi:3-oxosteroid 1-dehydrogenase